MKRDADSLRHELVVLSRLARSLSTATRLDEVLFETVRAVCEVLQSDDCVLYLFDEDLQELTQRAAWGEKLDPVTREIVSPLKLRMGQGIVGWVAASRVVEIIDDVTVDRRYIPDLKPGGSELTVPILHQDRLLGVLDAECHRARAFGADEAFITTRIADFCAPAIAYLRRRELDSRAVEEALREAEYRLRHVTTHDPLTGLLDRRHFDEQLAAALAAQATAGPAVSLAIFALDRFDQVNRKVGPAAGDAILKGVAGVLRERARRGDVTARIAGVEFALLLRGASAEEALALVQETAAELVTLPLPDGAGALAVSAGLASLAPGATETAESLVARATRARLAAAATGGGVGTA